MQVIPRIPCGWLLMVGLIAIGCILVYVVIRSMIVRNIFPCVLGASLSVYHGVCRFLEA